MTVLHTLGIEPWMAMIAVDLHYGLRISLWAPLSIHPSWAENNAEVEGTISLKN